MLAEALDAEVLIIDHEPLHRRALAEALRGKNLRVREAITYQAALTELRRPRVDMIVVEPEVSGAADKDLLESIKLHAPDALFVVWTGRPSKTLQAEARRLGGAGWFTKPHVEEIVALASRLFEGLSFSVANGRRSPPIDAWDSAAREFERLFGLSERQGQLVSLMVRGMSSKEIAAHLGLDYRTVGEHLARACRKVRVSDRLQLAAKFVEMVLIGNIEREGDSPERSPEQ